MSDFEIVHSFPIPDNWKSLYNPEDADKFSYYSLKAENALRALDTKKPRSELRQKIKEDPECLSGFVRLWRKYIEKPISRPHKHDSEKRKEGLAKLVERKRQKIESIEASIGRAFLEAIAEGNDETINNARKAWRENTVIQRPKRILERRIILALQSFYSWHWRVPTKGELFEELERCPIEDADVTQSIWRYSVKAKYAGTPKRVSRKQFRDACANLNLTDLPEGEHGNPNFRKGGEKDPKK